jgi:hypothetical protein
MDTSETEPVQLMNEGWKKMQKTLQELETAALPTPAPALDTSPANAKLYGHYFKELPAGVTHIDVYRVIQLFGVPAGPLDHAVKKLLCSGNRGRTAKNQKQDLVEARDAISRALEMLEEDEWAARLNADSSEF